MYEVYVQQSGQADSEAKNLVISFKRTVDDNML